MKYGLSEQQLQEIIDFFSKFPEIEKAILFGSRALGTFKKASDIDIAIIGEKVDFFLAAHIQYELEEETYLPFFFDIIAYDSIENEALKRHIKTHGQIIYERPAISR